MKAIIADYLAQATRNRLVFCHEPIEGLLFVNVGRSMAEALSKENLKSPLVAYAAEDFLSEILSVSNYDASIDQYIALENIGILFESELGFNLRSAFENASKNKTLIICSNGFIQNDTFYFLKENDESRINLQGLSYLEI